MVFGRVVKSPIPATGHGRGRMVISPIPATCHCKVMVGGRVVKLSIPATGHGRKQGGKITTTCYMLW